MDSKSDQTDSFDKTPMRGGGGRRAKHLAQAVLRLDSTALRGAARELRELEMMLSADYHENAAVPSAVAARELRDLVESEVPVLNGFTSRQREARLRVRHPAPCCQEISLRAAPYTSGAGLGLWGFSCAMRTAGQGTFVIYLNTAHAPGAVAITAAHELGHYFQHSMVSGSGHVGFAPMAANFSSHLHDEGELFADSAAALAAFGCEAADEMVRGAGEPTAARIVRARQLARPGFRIELASGAMSPRWRLRYLTATAHLMNLRVALRQVAGI